MMHDGIGAAFYIGTNDDAEYLGEIPTNGHPNQLDPFFLFKHNQDDSYTENDYRHDVENMLKHAPKYPSQQTPWVYAYRTGSIFVYHEGYLMGQIHPHGSRKKQIKFD